MLHLEITALEQSMLDVDLVFVFVDSEGSKFSHDGGKTFSHTRSFYAAYKVCKYLEGHFGQPFQIRAVRHSETGCPNAEKAFSEELGDWAQFSEYN